MRELKSHHHELCSIIFEVLACASLPLFGPLGRTLVARGQLSLRCVCVRERERKSCDGCETALLCTVVTVRIRRLNHHPRLRSVNPFQTRLVTVARKAKSLTEALYYKSGLQITLWHF